MQSAEQNKDVTQTESSPEYLILQPFPAYFNDAWDSEYTFQGITQKCGDKSLAQVSDNTLGSIDRIFNFFPFPDGIEKLSEQLRAVLKSINLDNISLEDLVKGNVPSEHTAPLNYAFMQTVLLHSIITLFDPFTGELKNEVREALRKKYPNYNQWETTYSRTQLEMTLLHSYVINVIAFNIPLYLEHKKGDVLDFQKATLFQKSITNLFGPDEKYIDKLKSEVTIWRKRNVDQALASIKALSEKIQKYKLLSESTSIKLTSFLTALSLAINGGNSSPFLTDHGIDILVNLNKVLKKQAEVYMALFDSNTKMPINLDFSQQLNDITKEKAAFIQRYAEITEKPKEYQDILEIYDEVINSTSTWLEAKKSLPLLTSQEMSACAKKLLLGKPLDKNEEYLVKKTLRPHLVSYTAHNFPYNINTLISSDITPATRFLAMHTAISDNPTSSIALYDHFYHPRARAMYSFDMPRNNMLFAAFQAQLVIDQQSKPHIINNIDLKNAPNTIVTNILRDALDEPGFFDRFWGTPRFHKNQIAKDIIGNTPFHLVDTLLENNPYNKRAIAKIVVEANSHNKKTEEGISESGHLGLVLKQFSTQLSFFHKLFNTEEYKLQQAALKLLQEHQVRSDARTMIALYNNPAAPQKKEPDKVVKNKTLTKSEEESEENIEQYLKAFETANNLKNNKPDNKPAEIQKFEKVPPKKQQQEVLIVESDRESSSNESEYSETEKQPLLGGENREISHYNTTNGLTHNKR